jgi:hypothetical protein
VSARSIDSPLCDVYIPKEVKGELLAKCVLRRHVGFDIQTEKSYVGYCRLNVKRLVGLMAVVRLKDIAKTDAFNVPIRYRDCPHIGFDEARLIAAKVDYGDGRKASYDEHPFLRYSHPLYWVFSLTGGDGSIAGGSVCVDRVDGHVWSSDELEEYSHDFNNAFLSV